MTHLPRYAPDTIRHAIAGALGREGVPDEVRDAEARLLTDAELQGVPSHGLLMLPRLISGIRDGRVTRAPNLEVVRNSAAVCVLDGDRGPGRYVGEQGMQAAVERAGRFGIGACLAVNTTHWGRAYSYASLAAREGFIGICATNAIPNMLAPGSTIPLLGNNPLAIGVPRGAGQEPLVLDLAMSQAAVGRVATAKRLGALAGENWGLDADGRPTDDPSLILASRRLLPAGGHKGAGLAIMLELLTAGLAAGPFGHEIAGADPSGLDPGASKLFLALDVGAFSEPAEFTRRVDRFLAYLRDAEPGAAVTYPGERGLRTRAEYERDGIPVHPEVIAELRQVGVELRGGARRGGNGRASRRP